MINTAEALYNEALLPPLPVFGECEALECVVRESTLLNCIEGRISTVQSSHVNIHPHTLFMLLTCDGIRSPS